MAKIETLLSLYRAAGHEVPELKSQSTVGNFNTVTVSDWYQRNGYYRIAGALGGYSSYAGKSVNEETALQSVAFYAGVKIISEDMGSLPFFLYQRSADRTLTEKAFEHPYYEVLHDLPNPETTSGEFVEALTAHALITGNGYARIERLRTGRAYLFPLMPSQVRPERTARNVPVFVLYPGTAEEKTVPADQVFNLRGFTFDGTSGDRVLQRASNMLGLNLVADEYAGRYFAQDATPGVIITRPPGAPKLGPEAVKAFKEAWVTAHQGTSKAHEPVILQEGSEAKLLHPNAQETQILETRQHGVIEVCRLLRLPPHRLADLSRATFSNIEQQGIEYAQYTLTPWQRRWRQTVYRCLLTLDERAVYYAEHEVAAILRGDFQAQSEGFRKLLEKGVYSINEVRRWLNLNPVSGGDEHFIQVNMATVQDVASGATLDTGGSPTMPISGVRP